MTCKIGRKSKLERGFRLSDHDTGERRRTNDDLPTIIDSDDVTIEMLLDIARIDNDELAALDARAIALDIKENPADPCSGMVMSEKRITGLECHQAELMKFNARMAWIAERCPEWDNLDKIQRNRVKQAFYQIYQPDSDPNPYTDSLLYHICEPDQECLAKITAGWPDLMTVNCSFSTLDDAAQYRKSGKTGKTGKIIAEEQGLRRSLTEEEYNRFQNLIQDRMPEFKQVRMLEFEQDRKQKQKQENELESKSKLELDM